MGDGKKTSPVSGEIMAGRAAAPGESGPKKPDGGEIHDAEFETVMPDGERTVPEAARHPAPVDSHAAGETAPGGMAILRRSPESIEPGRRERAGAGFWLAGVALAAAAFWVSGGHALVLSGAADAVQREVRPLRIDGLDVRLERHGGAVKLLVDGELVNDGGSALPAPPLSIIVRLEDGGVTRYRLGTNGRPVQPGGRMAFSSRLDAPQGGVRDVSVTLVED